MLAACTTAPPPPPAVTPQGDDRYLVDPRIGYTATVTPAIDRRFETIWRFIESGQVTEARTQLIEFRKKNPDYLPATLAEAAIEAREGNIAGARTTVERVKKRGDYLAANIYEAELAARAGENRQALDLYTKLQGELPDVSRERIASIRQHLFDELIASSRTAADAESVRLLREALAIDPAARETRVQLVQKLLAERRFDEARTELDPLLNSDPDRPEVQESLAEIDIGRGQFEQAIVRYERLSRRDARYTRRLEEIKQQWSAANMPPQYRRASESDAITRGDFAVLLYWKVPSVRFAQNLGSPPIAVDIENVLGRDEIVRAIALGILQVDPITRRVGSNTLVTPGALTRFAARVLTARGAACARGISDASKILAACSVTDPSATMPPDAPVSARAAESVIAELDRVLSR
jgi:Tfp pilus assembly protein PilF